MRIPPLLLLASFFLPNSAMSDSAYLDPLFQKISSDPAVYDVRHRTPLPKRDSESKVKPCNKEALLDIADPSIFFGGPSLTPASYLFDLYFIGCPSLAGHKDRVKAVHYAIPPYSEQVSGHFQDGELYSAYNLRGLPSLELLAKLRNEWRGFDDRFKGSGKPATVEDIFKFALRLDQKYGKEYLPPIVPAIKK